MMRELLQSERHLAADLLDEHKLPTEDLYAEYVQLYGYFSEQELIGCIGLEHYKDALLLRSLAVAKDRATCGVGTMLAEYVGRYAFNNGKKSIYLLTDSADGFFARLGYTVYDRAKAPESIRNTKQFAELCAESSILMKYEF